MALSAFPQGVSSFGMPIIGSGPVMTTGNVFFVDSGGTLASDNTSSGSSPDKPFSTMDYANGRCTANNGDVVFVMPGHTETVTAAAGLDLDTAGVTWIGLGNGSDRPTINFTTATSADMDVDAANITMVNFLFTGGIDALTGPIDVNAASFSMINCETRDVTGQTVDFIVTDANADYLFISGWRHRGASGAGAATAISIVGGSHGVIENFEIFGNFSTAGIENVTTAATNIRIGGGSWGANYIETVNSADIAITMVATTSGNLGPNIFIRVADNAANVTEAVAAADMQLFQPIAICNNDGEVALNTNITATVDE